MRSLRRLRSCKQKPLTSSTDNWVKIPQCLAKLFFAENVELNQKPSTITKLEKKRKILSFSTFVLVMDSVGQAMISPNGYY